MNHIELFAGCGGLSLGLSKAGFKLALANELSPMAAETFSYNFLNEDLELCAKDNLLPSSTFWLSSQFENLSKRLRENPNQYPLSGEGITSLPENPNDLEGKLLVGDIIQLNNLLENNKQLLQMIKTNFGQGEIDLVAGGPPCQSFSLAGLRQKDCKRNVLPWEFARFAGLVNPKCVILENVTGILRPFSEEGNKYYAWLEIAKVFATKGYIPLCIHVNAKYAGVAQSRPRFILLALRKDVYKKISHSFNEYESSLFDPCYEFYKNFNSTGETGTYNYYDFNNIKAITEVKDSFLSYFFKEKIISIKEAIDDLKVHEPSEQSEFVKTLNKYFQPLLPERDKIENHDFRRNSDHVQRRFRIYQVMQQCSAAAEKEMKLALKNDLSLLSDNVWQEVKNFKFLTTKNKLQKFKSLQEFMIFLSAHHTKKQTQRALAAELPAPAALSIPDDACHYDENEIRTLTVREMARAQSFPDSFVFRSKVTTGGKMRKFEVPQYTQVGNAVPPLLGAAIGKAVKNLLSRVP